MPGPSGSRPRNGGIRKRDQRERRDRDGDLIMGAAPRVNPIARTGRGKPPGSNKSNGAPTPGFTELKVTGWTDEKEMSKIIGFLERHSARRSTNVPKSHVPPKMIKRHRVAGTTLTIWVRPEDVNAFGKINGFTFTSTHGQQKLSISGSGIRSKSPTEAEANGETKESKSEVADLLKGFLQRRYNMDDKLLNLSAIAEDEEVAKSGMFNSATTQAKFFPALMIICDQTLKTAGQDKRDVINSVTLSGNNLPNVEIVKSLATTLPHIRNLDLTGNKFENVKDLKAFKNRFRQLEHLIVEFAQPGWEEEIIAWYPKLRILNGVQVRPDPAAAVMEATPTAAPVVPSPSPAPAASLTPEQEAMVDYVQKETRLRRDLAIACLEAGTWDINKAAELFLAQKSSLAPDSFI